MNKCSNCGVLKKWDEFPNSSNRSSYGLHSFCKACKKIKDHEYYLKRKARNELLSSIPENWDDEATHRRQLREKRKKNNQDRLYTYLRETTCSGCNISDPRVLLLIPDKNLGVKVSPISSLLYNSWARIEMELKWYNDVLCLNCRAKKKVPDMKISLG